MATVYELSKRLTIEKARTYQYKRLYCEAISNSSCDINFILNKELVKENIETDFYMRLVDSLDVEALFTVVNDDIILNDIEVTVSVNGVIDQVIFIPAVSDTTIIIQP